VFPAAAAREIMASLRKIYRDKDVEVELRIPGGLSCAIDRGDLYELLGNLMDNAWKWCRSRIVVSATLESGTDAGRLLLTVDDDGPGISSDQAAGVFRRGARGDQRGEVEGQGIGLAVVEEIVTLYRGSVSIGRSALGGASLEVRLPAGGPSRV